MKKYSKTDVKTTKVNENSKPKKVMRTISIVLCISLLMAVGMFFTSCVSEDDFFILESEIKMLEEEVRINLYEIDTLKALQAEANTALEEMKNKYESAQGALALLESSNKAAKDEIESLKQANTSAEQEISKLKEEANATRDAMTALKESNNAAEQEIADLKAQIEELENASQGSSEKKIKIYIDQGHNPTSYHNAGASGNGLYEQDLTFTIGILLAELLEEDGRFDVRLSRPTIGTVLGTDNESSLDARVQGAIDFGADYFISLHINSFDSDTANGIEVYAAEQDSVSYRFGNSLLNGLVSSTNLRNRGMKLGPDLRVLKNATMPAVLLELGFISNSDDAALLSESPELFAQGIYNGILSYYGLRPKNSSN